MGNSMAVGVTRYFTKTATDPDLVEILDKHALDLAAYEVHEAKNLFEKSGHPRPQAFTSEDLNYDAPALFGDNMILLVKYILSQDAGTVYSVALSEATRSDVRQYYLTCITRTIKFLDEVVTLMERKGLFLPKIYLPIPGSIEKVHKQSFAGGWLAGRRPLNSQEIMEIVSLYRNLEVEREFLRAFIQITTSKKLAENFKRGEQMAKKQMAVLQKLLTEDDLPQQPTWESEVTDSKVAPFSERLMLFKISVFASSTVGRYGRAIATTMRKDVGVELTRLMGEIALYGEDTLNLMIELGFLDQLPLSKAEK